MTRTAWEIFQGATVALTRSGTLKDRLNDAYQNHLAWIDEKDLPKELRDDYRAFNNRLTREPPLLRGEDSVRATIRKMSSCEAEDAALAVVRIFSGLQRPAVRATTATVAPFYRPVTSSPAPAELHSEERRDEREPLVAKA